MSSPQLTPDQAKSILALALPSLKSEHQITKSVIEAIPLDKGNYRPDAVSKTALELAWHIVGAEKRFLNGILVGGFDFSPIHRPEAIKDSAGIAAWFDESFAASLPKLEAASGEQLARMIDFRGLLQLSAVSFLQVALNHTIHHRGQLSIVPATHGSESAVHLR
jgi:uncharacterized damage-inducible protein DinB